MSGLILIGGGVRCGKSRFALELALQASTTPLFVATAQPGDDEMRQRIASHQAERGDRFTTVEAPLEVLAALRNEEHDVAVLDCLTLWLTNQLLADMADEAIVANVQALAALATGSDRTIIVVTNEVGMGLVPDHALGRRFRDLAGQAHQLLSADAAAIYAGLLGTILRIKPGPVELVNR